MITLIGDVKMPALWISPHIALEPFTPPVPLLLCLVGAGLVIVASFALVGFFARSTHEYVDYPKTNLLRLRFFRLVNSYLVVSFARFASIFIFALVIGAGLWGNPDPIFNVAPTFIWVIWWVGLAYVSAFLGDLWSVLNPWKIIFEWASQAFRLVGLKRPTLPILAYPQKLGAWPAVALFSLFVWIENVYSDSVVPIRISQLILLYSIITWTGMVLFGKQVWLRNGEAFSLVFRFLAKFAIIELREEHGDPIDGQNTRAGAETARSAINYDGNGRKTKFLALRLWATGLLDTEKVSISEMVFILLLLAAVTFDGFMGTLPWKNIQTTAYEYIPNVMVIGTLGLIVGVLIFVGLYLVFIVFMKVVSGIELGAWEFATSFVYSLIPIVLAYHIAHFLIFFLVQGQLMIPLISDPFGSGWDIVGTSNYRLNFRIVSPNFYWAVSVVSIVLGHMIAVFVAHVIALRIIRSRHYALRSQYPMLVLMVVYTVASLWIITQPMYMASM